MSTVTLNEEWADAPSPGNLRYQVSSLGRVRRWVTYRARWRMLKPYRMVCDRRRSAVDLGQTRWMLHALVMHAFAGPRPEGAVINHLDGDPTNNALANLEYTSVAMNAKHAFETGLCPPLRGSSHPNSKLTEAQVLGIANRLPYETNVSLAEAHGVSVSLISKIRRGSHWAWLTGIKCDLSRTALAGEDLDAVRLDYRTRGRSQASLALSLGVGTAILSRVLNREEAA